MWIMWICNRNVYLRLVCLFCIFILWIIGQSEVYKGAGVQNSEDLSEKNIVVLLIPGLSFEEMDAVLEEARYEQLWSSGAFGSINLKPDGSYSYLNNAVSLSTGKRGLGVKGWNAFEREELIDGTPVDELFLQWYGKAPLSSIVHPYFHLLEKKNKEGSFEPTIGLLGENLNQQQVYTYVIGNSDVRNEKTRYGSLFTMDQKGNGNGDLHSVIVDNYSFPTGKKTDSVKLVDKINQIQGEQGRTFIVVEWGDLHRLFSEAELMEADHYEDQYTKTLANLEKTIYSLFAETKGELWMVSPNVNTEAYKRKNQLGPVWVWKEERGQKGMLYSNTTRRTSLVSNTDLADTWINAFTSKNDDQNSSIDFIEDFSSDDWYIPKFQQRLKEINYVFDKRGAVLSSYVSSLVVLLIIVTFVKWLFNERLSWRNGAILLLLSGVLSPFLFLVSSPWVINVPPLIYVLFIMAGSIVLALLLKRLTKHPFSLACFFTFFSLAVDVSLGSYLTHRSFLSYDPVIGARYYGIGNEYAGIFLVCGLFSVTPFLNDVHNEKRKEKLKNWTKTAFMLLLIIFVLGASTLGANAGASISTGMVFLFVSYCLLLKKNNLVVKSSIIGFVTIILFVALYLLQMGQPNSHISLAFQSLFQGEWSIIWNTIERKLQMNWKIFRISYWTQLFITSYFLIGIVLWRQKKDQLHEQQRFLLNGAVVGSLALLILNDSGIVAAATSMFITLSVCYGWSFINQLEEKG
ncbi:hypothetical protein QA612_00065 [Evansella sp. AB-P1]|uniref:hypothetical protein n=1 Tax=Evansella sp. AB-P1 TaxID=3037653 RepID=UPI00241DF069|nr:hypothetical protein [Evansella sp. AB-P1]MDG5785866.1 hypothetical protein [Evansella sp. AB-P1]